MVRKMLPSSVKKYLKFKRLKKRNPTSEINTRKISGIVVIGKNNVIYEGVDLRHGVELGDYVLVNTDTIIRSAKVGSYTSIGPRCQIGMPEHPVDHMTTSPFIYNRNRSIMNLYSWEELQNPPIIGNDVWIGGNVVVVQGVTIGDGAIIAAGAVVTKDVKPYTIVGGVPAKPIRKRFDDETIQYLLDLKWWNMPFEELINYKPLFEVGSEWIEKINEQ